MNFSFEMKVIRDSYYSKDTGDIITVNTYRTGENYVTVYDLGIVENYTRRSFAKEHNCKFLVSKVDTDIVSAQVLDTDALLDARQEAEHNA